MPDPNPRLMAFMPSSTVLPISHSKLSIIIAAKAIQEMDAKVSNIKNDDRHSLTTLE